MNKVLNTVEVTKNSFHNDGDGIVSFPNGLVISDDQTQRNGTRYDINSLDISKYGGQLTADHEDKLKNIIGRVEGISKDGGRLKVNKIVYAVKQNPYARLAYDLLVNGFSRSFSTETIGPMPTADGTNYNHELVGLSQVVTPNNYSANVNQLTQVVHNSLEEAQKDGLDVDGIEEQFMNHISEENMPTDETKTVVADGEVEVNENSQTEVVEQATDENESEKVVNKAEKAPKDEDGEEITDEPEDAEKGSDEPTDDKSGDDDESDSQDDAEDVADDEEDDKKSKNSADEVEVENQLENEVDNALDATQETEAMVEALTELVRAIVDEQINPEPTDEDEVSGVEEIVADDILNSADEETKELNEMDKTEVKNAVLDALKELQGDEASEPVFQKNEVSEKQTNSFDNLDWKQRYGKQVNAAYDAFRNGNIAAREELAKINDFNFNALKESGKVSNAMTIESMGNFVLPPEMYEEIQGRRTDYTALINATEWRETDRLEFAWLKRKGDIDMKNVAMCNDDADGNLKPISEYEAEPVTSKLEEMAAVTVVCNAATRFLAADLLGDVAAGYRNDYDRKRAQLIIARMEQAVEETGLEVDLNDDSDTSKMVAWLRATSEISDATVNGTFIFNNKTFAKLKEYALTAGTNGPLSSIFTDGQIPQIFGIPYIVVPNDLMPTIESDDEIKFQVDGKDVEITHSVFYADLNEFTGRTSGGLQYNVSTEASYEVGGQTRSAYQRNEMVLRGSFFRGGAIKDTSRVAGVTAQASYIS